MKLITVKFKAKDHNLEIKITERITFRVTNNLSVL